MARRINPAKFKKVLRGANKRLRGDLLFYLDGFVEQTGMAETRVSFEAMGDRSFFIRVRKGGYPSPPKYDKAVAWMDMTLKRLAADQRRAAAKKQTLKRIVE